MIRKIALWVILLPLGALILAFAVANRQTVTLTLDPLGLADSTLTFALPLFVLAFLLVIVGVIVGGFATWVRQARWRRASRRLDGEVRALRAENDELKRRLAAVETSPRSETAKIALRPPAA